MLPKYFTLIFTFLSFSSPVSEENAVSVRDDTFTCKATSSQLLTQKFQVNKSKSFSNFAFSTVL